MIKVLIADDHVVVRKGLRQILTEMPDIVVAGEAESVEEVMRLVQAEPWSVVVLDIKLKGGSGLDLLSWIRKERPQLPVLILTVYPEDQYAARSIKAGAAGFLTKETASEKLIEAVRKVASGGRYLSAEVAEALASMLAAEAGGAPHERLTDREFEILKLFGAGKTVSEIAASLGLSVKTVSTHRTRILGKMNLRTNAELMRYAMQAKLVE